MPGFFMQPLLAPGARRPIIGPFTAVLTEPPMKKLALFLFAALLASPAIAEDMPVVTKTMDVPAGDYELDLTHTSLVFRVNHMGLSNYTARFTKIDGDLYFDPKNPATSRVNVTIDPKSIETDFPLTTVDFDAELWGEKFLDANTHTTIIFKSTGIAVTGANTGIMTGDLTLHGVTKPITLNVTFNGGYLQIPMDPSKSTRIGFSARGTLQRSAFGIGYGIPAAGSTLGVGDTVDVSIEAEFTKPETAVAG
jgi:polyisoprenoid-binding protein YceI